MRHTVILGPNFIGLGNRPVFTPAHQVDFDTGIGPFGAKMSLSRTKPVFESLNRFSTASL